MALYGNRDMREYLLEELEDVEGNLDSFLVYVMGPYTTQDLSYYLKPDENGANEYEAKDTESNDEVIELDDSLLDFGAFEHSEDMHEVLKEIVNVLREDVGVNAFLATEANIPLPDESSSKKTLDPITQSIRFSQIANCVVFVLPFAGLRDGVTTEIGSVLENNLQPTPEDGASDDPIGGTRPEERYRIFREKDVSSKTLGATIYRYDVPIKRFEDRDELVQQLRHFIKETIIRERRGDLEEFE